MYSKILKEIRKLLSEATEEPEELIELHESQVGDISSTIAFRLAKVRRKNPREIAENIVMGIERHRYIQRIEAVDGYVNFYLNYSELLIPVLEEIRAKGKNYGRSEPKNKKILLEHTSINPSGPIHIGRLRNSLIGDSLARILKFSGYDVETHYYVNDIGKQIAIIAQGLKEGVEPDQEVIGNYKEYKEKPDFQIFFEYVSANRKFEKDPEFGHRVQDYIKRAEGGDRKALMEIGSVAKKCLEGQKQVFNELGIQFDHFDFESRYIEDGSVENVLEFLKKSRFYKALEKGSGLDLKEFGLERREGLSTLARSDGTSVYLARDIAYHLEKSKKGNLMINVLGEDHKFEFRELKTILTEIYKMRVPLEVVHYSFVNFEGEELSTRKGIIVPVDKLLDEALKKAEKEIEKRKIARKEIAPVIGIGAVKYHILKTTPNKPITFRWDDALSFEGDSSPYIQYAHARCCRILERSGIEGIDINAIDLNLEREEEGVIKLIMKFSQIVKESAEELKPNLIANYLYALASEFSRFYKKCPVLPAEEKTRDRRLLIVNAVRQVLANGLNLLGIGAPERM